MEKPERYDELDQWVKFLRMQLELKPSEHFPAMIAEAHKMIDQIPDDGSHDELLISVLLDMAFGPEVVDECDAYFKDLIVKELSG